MAKKKNTQPEKRPDAATPGRIELELPVKYVFADGHTAVAANQAGVNRNDTEVSLLFFFARPPVFSGEQAEILDHFANLQHIDARCVAEVVMHPIHFLRFANIVNEQAAKLVREMQEKYGPPDELPKGDGG